MKGKIKYLIICILTLISCSRQEEECILRLSEISVTFPNIGGSAEISVVGRQDWVTDNTAEWISIRKRGEKAILTVETNHAETRQRTISFILDDKTMAELTVTQEKSEEFSIDKDLASIGYKGGEIKLNITCFGSWTGESGSEWISINPNNGHSPAEISITVDETQETSQREGVVTFRSDGRSLNLTIRQAERPYIEVEKSAVEFNGDGGYADILYMSNVDVRITCNEEWIRLIESDSQTKKISFEAMRNISDSREGSIKIESLTDEEIFKTISVRQGKKIDHPGLSFEEGTSMLLYSKESIQLHPIFTDMSDKSLIWKSDDTTIAEVDQNGMVTIHKGGTCTISAVNEHHRIQASIVLNIMPKAESMTILLEGNSMKEIPVAVRFPGNTATLSVMMDPDDAYSEDVTFLSSDPAIGKIVGRTLHCIAPGKATIYAESLYQGLRESFTLIVRE